MSEVKLAPKQKIIIKGITTSGSIFRPSDWAERISGTLSTNHNRRICYSPLLQPTSRNGCRCVELDPALEEANPELYQAILQFAKSNNLAICYDDEIDRDPV